MDPDFFRYEVVMYFALSHLMTWIQTHFDRVQLCNNSNSSLHYILHMTSAQALEMSGSHRQLQSLLQGYTLVLSIFPT